MNIKLIANKWGIETWGVEIWLERVKPNPEHLERALTELTKEEGRSLVSNHFKPEPYLLAHRGLINSVWEVQIDIIKSLDIDVYKKHLEHLIFVEKSGKRNEFCADAFIVYRHYNDKRTLHFTDMMFKRSVSANCFSDAVNKLFNLANKHENLSKLKMDMFITVNSS